jgi:hypothetical protein
VLCEKGIEAGMLITAENGLQWDEQEVAATRYPDGVEIAGRGAWVRLVERVEAGSRENAWAHFVGDIETLVEQLPPKPHRVFVSHQRKDVDAAERLAYLATQAGLEYWLDIHDPTLIGANNQTITGPQRAILIAGIIEIALLNCRYIVAAHSTNSLASKWIPYEFARVKEHIPFADDAAGWFEPTVQAGLTEDYFELARKTYGEGAPATAATAPWNPWQPVGGWLKARGGGGRAPRNWKRLKTPPKLL